MARSGPPPLTGLTFVEPIGAGGFADVYLYQQEFPARRVAVKVLRESSDEAGVAQFRAEANVMAQLSGHPSIVPIFQADVSADGHAYLVMEFCPPPHLAQRFRAERIPVPDVLDIGVKISSAVETAHRVGILHRDIKPHNILTSAYGAPLLTDFGIASVAGDTGSGGDAMSVPWSPPEVFTDPSLLDVRSDVYSLAATVYSLLAGRSPFEVPGGANDNATLIHRIERQEPTRVLRADVPESLNGLLLRALSKRLEERPSSAMAFARALQEVQIELGHAPTRLEVLDASPDGPAVAATADARTEIKPISIIVPDEIAARGTLLRPRQIQVDNATTLQSARPPVPPAPDTLHHRPAQPVDLPPPPGAPPVPAPAPPTPAQESPGTRSRVGILVASGLAAILALAVVVAVVWGGGDDEPTRTTPQTDPGDSIVISGGPSTPTDLDVRQRRGRVVFSWRNPGGQDGDTFLVKAGPQLTELVEVARPREPTVAVPAKAGEQVCVSVATVRGSEISREALEECTVAR